MKFALLAVTGACGLLAACAEDYPPPAAAPVAVVAAPAAPVPADAACFRTSDIVNHRIGDDHTLYVRTRSGGVWRVEMVGACLAGAGPDDPLVMREPAGVPYACRPVDLDISVRKGGAMNGIDTPCIVNSMIRLSSAEVDGLPDRLRP